MPLNSDFEDLFAAFSAEEVEYLLVGGYAVMLYSEPRHTKDLDVWVRPSEANASRVLAALARFGAPLFDLTHEDLCRPGVVFQMGVPPNRIDLLTRLDGVDFPTAARRATRVTYGGVEVPVIALEDLLRNKETVGRPRDLLDAEVLRRALVDQPDPADP